MIKSPLIQKLIETNRLSMEEVLSTKGRIYTFVNPVSYQTALDNEELFVPFDGLFADGSLMVKTVEMCYGETVKRWSVGVST